MILHFDTWYNQADKVFQAAIGVSLMDLPDSNEPRESWECGDTPEDFAKDLIDRIESGDWEGLL